MSPPIRRYQATDAKRFKRFKRFAYGLLAGYQSRVIKQCMPFI